MSKDYEPYYIPAELLEYLDDEPLAKQVLLAMPEARQKEYADWVTAAKRPETKVARIIEMIGRLKKGRALRDQ